MGMEEYERSIKYFKHAHLLDEEDIETLYGYSVCIFRNCLKFKDKMGDGVITHEKDK
jgi:hypothetical protein